MSESTTERDNEAVVRRYVEEGYNEKDPAVLRETMAEDVVVHGLLGAGGPVEGIEAYGEYAAALMRAFPDMAGEIHDLESAGDRVVARWTIAGTHEGELFGIEPTGESIEVEGLALLRMEEGRIAEKRYRQDDLGLLEQLGLVEIPMG